MVQRAARLLGVDQVHRKLARILDCGLDRTLGDLGKLHTVERDFFGQAFLPENFVDVPGNGLAFAVEIRRQVYRLGLASRLDDAVDVLLAALVEFVGHGEVIFGIDRAIAGRQVPDVTIGSQHLEVRPEVPVDGAGFGR